MPEQFPTNFPIDLPGLGKVGRSSSQSNDSRCPDPDLALILIDSRHTNSPNICPNPATIYFAFSPSANVTSSVSLPTPEMPIILITASKFLSVTTVTLGKIFGS